MNRTIKLLLVSDTLLYTGFGLIAPIFAIFIKDNLVGGSIFAAGIASTIYLVTKSLVQLPFSRYIDEHDDKVKWLILGTFLIALVPIIYIFSTNIYHIYFAQLLYGLAGGLVYPVWLSLWSTNMDKHHEGYEWSLYSTITSLGEAGTAAIGAAVAMYFGFTPTFILVGIISLVGAFILFGLERKERKGKVKTLHYHKKRKIAKRHH